MSSFEEQLWAELVREQATLSPPSISRPIGRRHRQPLIPIALSGFVSVCAILVVLVLSRGGGGAASAFALTQGSDALGPKITLTLKEVIAIGPANEALSKLGVHVRVAKVVAGCPSTGTLVPSSELPSQRNAIAAMATAFYAHTQGEAGSQGPIDMTWAIHPRLIPVGDTLLIRAEGPRAARAPYISLYRGAAPECVSPIPPSEVATHR